MPYVEGESLREKLNREKQLSIEESLEITKSVASALDYAHRQNVIHRDIKPENILLHDGQPVVADFGISLAVSAAGGTRLTETGLSLGTPQYMSPEQATGDREVDGRSDVYSLACVLYEMLAGDPPHTGSTVQAVIAKVVTDSPRPVTELRNTVPPHVAAVVHKALAKLPADRFGEASAFAAALSDKMFTASLPSRVSVNDSKTWTRPTKVFAIASVLLAVMLVFVSVRSLARQEEHAEPSRWIERLPPSSQFDLSLWQRPFAVSPDGNRIAYVAQDSSGNRLYLRNLNEHEASAVPNTSGAGNPFFSPDGDWLAFFADGKLQKVSTGGGSPLVFCETSLITAGAHWGIKDTIPAGVKIVVA